MDVEEKWPLGRRTALVTLELETIEIGKNTYDFKKPDESKSGEVSTTVVPFPSTDSKQECHKEIVTARGSVLFSSIYCPWQALTFLDQSRIAKALRDPKNGAVVSALNLLKQNVDEPETTYDIHSVKVICSKHTPPKIVVQITYGNTEFSPAALFEGIAGDTESGENSLAHAYRAGNNNWVLCDWEWDQELDNGKITSSKIRPALLLPEKYGSLLSTKEIQYLWDASPKMVPCPMARS